MFVQIGAAMWYVHIGKGMGEANDVCVDGYVDGCITKKSMGEA